MTPEPLDPLQAIILGVVQGLTEFLPISSSAHLVFVPWLFGWREPGLAFDVALHMGTLLAVLVYFAPDWYRLIRAFFGSVAERRIGDDPERRLVWFIGLASFPAAVAGLVAEERIEALFHNEADMRGGIVIIAIMLILMGGVLLLAEGVGKRTVELRNISLVAALSIGLAQALALIPGVSRSGSTITAGLFFGLKREAAARFSFLLATPVVLGAGLKKVYDVLGEQGGIPTDQQLGFLLGFLSAAVSGFLCIYFLLRYLQRHSTAPFIVYRFIVGIALLGLALSGFRPAP